MTDLFRQRNFRGRTGQNSLCTGKESEHPLARAVLEYAKEKGLEVKKRQRISGQLQETDFQEDWEKPGFMVET